AAREEERHVPRPAHLDVERAGTVAVRGWDDEGVVARVDGDDLGTGGQPVSAGEAAEARRAGPHLAQHRLQAERAERLRPLVRRAERDDAADAGGAGTER